MAWIICQCTGCPGCKKPKVSCGRSKEVGPPRSAASRPGLCDACKTAHGSMYRPTLLTEAVVTVAKRRQTLLRIKGVISN